MNLITPEKNQESRDLKEKELVETGAHVCINCEYWLRSNPEADDGECHRFPPTVFAFPGKSQFGSLQFASNSFFPRCRAEISCGEFKATSHITTS